MTPDVFSVEQVAARLGLHVRTVRNYVRAGRLKAVRIGKQYRIAAADLEAFTGLPVAAAARTAELSGVAELGAVDPAAADRIAALVDASVNGMRDPGKRRLRAETVHDEERGSVKVIVSGDLAAGADLLRLVASFAESLA